MDGQDAVSAEDQQAKAEEAIVNEEVTGGVIVAPEAVEDVGPPEVNAQAQEETLITPEPIVAPADAPAVVPDPEPIPVLEVRAEAEAERPEMVEISGERIEEALAPLVPNVHTEEKTEKPFEPTAPTKPLVEQAKPEVTTPKPDPMEIAKSLDHDVLEAAFRLLASERSAGLLEAKRKSDAKKVKENSDRVYAYIAKHNGGVKRTTIADKLNMSPSKVTDYVQRLLASGKIRAEGKTNDRRFFVG